MKLLLDTHAFLWLMSGDARLSKKAVDAFLDTDNRLYFSLASLWEISIKISLGKLAVPKNWLVAIESEMKINGIQWLAIDVAHCKAVEQLTFYHRDPFDRMLVAQAQVEAMSLLTHDKHFNSYDVDCLW